MYYLPVRPNTLLSMLNITNRISLSNAAGKLVRKLYRKQGNRFLADSWTRIPDTVKNEISKKLLTTHGIKCVYCERYLWALTPEIDHFAHKALYPQFTFTLTNLFYSCGHCNSSGRKGSKPTIITPDAQYQKCVFKILHPYRDQVDLEIKYRDADRIFFDLPNCSALGLETISFFGFDDPIMTQVRSKTLIFERDIVLTTQEERELLHQIIAYKPQRRKK